MAKSKDVITQIRKATRCKFSADEKIRIVLEGLRGQSSISEVCRRGGIAASVYYKWSSIATGMNPISVYLGLDHLIGCGTAGKHHQ